MPPSEERETFEAQLVTNLSRSRDELRALLDETSSHWGYEDVVYRFYHQSFKVVAVQGTTTAIATRLQALVPERPLNAWLPCPTTVFGTRSSTGSTT